jgi:hypothetical protein
VKPDFSSACRYCSLPWADYTKVRRLRQADKPRAEGLFMTGRLKSRLQRHEVRLRGLSRRGIEECLRNGVSRAARRELSPRRRTSCLGSRDFSRPVMLDLAGVCGNRTHRRQGQLPPTGFEAQGIHQDPATPTLSYPTTVTDACSAVIRPTTAPISTPSSAKRLNSSPVRSGATAISRPPDVCGS